MSELHVFHGQTYSQARSLRDAYKLRCMVAGAVVHRIGLPRANRIRADLVEIHEEHAFSDLTGHWNPHAEAVGLLEYLWI